MILNAKFEEEVQVFNTEEFAVSAANSAEHEVLVLGDDNTSDFADIVA